MKIFKYSVEIHDEQTIVMPIGAKILSVGVQRVDVGGSFIDIREKVQLWALVDENAATEYRTIVIRGTGHDCDGFDEKRQIHRNCSDGRRISGLARIRTCCADITRREQQ